jgi:DNA-directed RNA polymerase subunit H (RpoH/RPB5)
VLTERISLDKLPKIWSSDPLQRYFNAKVGQVYEIEERYGSLQPEIKHRVVMEQSC